MKFDNNISMCQNKNIKHFYIFIAVSVKKQKIKLKKLARFVKFNFNYFSEKYI